MSNSTQSPNPNPNPNSNSGPSSISNQTGPTSTPVPSTPLPRYSGPATLREHLHYVSTLRFPRIPTPISIDRALRLFLHVIQNLSSTGNQHTFYWAQITAPEAGDSYVIQRQGGTGGMVTNSATRPMDSCDWREAPQIFNSQYSDWPIEILLYSKGVGPRQRNFATALARLEYRILIPNSNIVILQFIPLLALKGFNPLATGTPPFIPPSFASMMTSMMTKPAPRSPITMTSVPTSTTSKLPPQSINTANTIARHSIPPSLKKTTAITTNTGVIMSQQATSTTSMMGSIQSPLFPEEPIELVNLMPFDAIDEIDQSILKTSCRTLIFKSLFQPLKPTDGFFDNKTERGDSNNANELAINSTMDNIKEELSLLETTRHEENQKILSRKNLFESLLNNDQIVDAETALNEIQASTTLPIEFKLFKKLLSPL